MWIMTQTFHNDSWYFLCSPDVKKSDLDLAIWIIPCHSWVHFSSCKFAKITRHNNSNDMSQDTVLAGLLSRSAEMEVSADRSCTIFSSCHLCGVLHYLDSHLMCNQERNSGDWWAGIKNHGPCLRQFLWVSWLYFANLKGCPSKCPGHIFIVQLR